MAAVLEPVLDHELVQNESLKSWPAQFSSVDHDGAVLDVGMGAYRRED